VWEGGRERKGEGNRERGSDGEREPESIEGGRGGRGERKRKHPA